MSSNLVIPFNNKPLSTSQKTTSYTIPTGHYAKVTGSFIPDQGTTATTYTVPKLTVDGNVVLYCNNFTVTNGSSVGSGSTFFTVPSDFSGIVYATAGDTSANVFRIRFDGSNISYTSPATTFSNQVFPVKSGTVFQNGTGGNLGVGIYSLYFKSSEPNMITIWVPSGTVLAGTAATFKWEVELYLDIT